METCRYLHLLLVLALASVAEGQNDTTAVPDHFYPFGREVGDRVVAPSDDGNSGRINTTTPFPFYDDLLSSLYVGTNGIISSFLRATDVFRADPFPLRDQRHLVAVYFSDVDNRDHGGQVFWRQTSNITVLSRATMDVRDTFVDQTSFSATWTFIATWYKVNTFQAVITTDGIHSFAFYHYHNMTWTGSPQYGADPDTGLGGVAAQVGFNAGDGVRYYTVSASQTPAVVKVDDTSNVGVPGRWAFRVDGNRIKAGGCGNSEEILISPNSGTFLGGQRISVSGPCFNKTDVVVCRFDGRDVTGDVISTSRADCVVPLTFSLGRRPIAISTDGGKTFSHKGVFIFVIPEKYDVNFITPQNWGLLNTSRPLVIKWDRMRLNSSVVQIDFIIFRVLPDSSVEQVSVFLGRIPNGGLFDLRDRLEFVDGLVLSVYGAVRVSETGMTSNRSQSLWTFVGPAMWYLKALVYEVAIRGRQKPPTDVETKRVWEAITKWVDVSQPNLQALVYTAMTNITQDIFEGNCSSWSNSESRDRPDFRHVAHPPCTLGQAVNDPDFVANPDCNMGQPFCYFYHPGAYHCVLAAVPSAGAGQEACYSRDGMLLPFEAGGGTYHETHIRSLVSTSKLPVLGHILDDVLPFMFCCKLSQNCTTYARLRPTEDCAAYEPAGSGWTGGDPHISNLDGGTYTFNGLGEFLLVEVDGKWMTLQGRAESFTPAGSALSGSVWTAFVMRVAGSSLVQVQKGRRSRMEVLVDGQSLDFTEEQSQYFEGFTATMDMMNSPGQVDLRFDQGVRMSVREAAGALGLQLLLTPAARGRTRGLLGVWNGNTTDDFMTPDNKTLPRQSLTTWDIHYRFGVTWRTTSKTSLFTYPAGKTHADYQNYAYVATLQTFSASSVFQSSKELCNGVAQCNFDLAVTKNETLAKETRRGVEAQKARLQQLKPVVTCGFPPALVNGRSNATGGPVGTSVVFQCNTGFRLVGTEKRTCQQNQSWSGEQPSCQPLMDVENTTVRPTSVETTIPTTSSTSTTVSTISSTSTTVPTTALTSASTSMPTKSLTSTTVSYESSSLTTTVATTFSISTTLPTTSSTSTPSTVPTTFSTSTTMTTTSSTPTTMYSTSLVTSSTSPISTSTALRDVETTTVRPTSVEMTIPTTSTTSTTVSTISSTSATVPTTSSTSTSSTVPTTFSTSTRTTTTSSTPTTMNSTSSEISSTSRTSISTVESSTSETPISSMSATESSTTAISTIATSTNNPKRTSTSKSSLSLFLVGVSNSGILLNPNITVV